MCGIIGYAGKPSRKELFPFIESLLVASEVRGTDGTGYFAIRQGVADVEKELLPASDFVCESVGFRSFAECMPELFVGHTRWASVGSAEDWKNLHPFTDEKVTTGLVHNGTLSQGDVATLERLSGGPYRSTTDSERIFQYVDVMAKATSVKDAVNSLLGLNLQGSFACSYISVDEHRIYLWRDGRQPMVVANVESLFGVSIFASTPEVIRAAWVDCFGTKSVNWIMSRIRWLEPRTVYATNSFGRFVAFPKESIITAVSSYSPFQGLKV